MPRSLPPRQHGRAGRLIPWAWLAGLAGPGGQQVHATVVEGLLPRDSSFAMFAEKFCYDYLNATATVGEVRLNLTRADHLDNLTKIPLSGRLYFMVFDDENLHWTKAKKTWATSTCEEKQAASSSSWEIQVPAGKQGSYYDIRIREHIRPRFWYFAFVGCDIKLGALVRYKVHTTNDWWGWQLEFSLDHMGLIILYAIFTVAFGVAYAVTACVSRGRSSAQAPPIRDHPYLQLLLLSYTASLASCALFLVHYWLFARDGNGSRRLRFLAVVASAVANCTIFLIAILSSTGWALTNFTLPNRRCFLGMILLVGGLSALVELHVETAVDPSTKLYGFQSGPSVLAVVLKLFIFCWFAFQAKNAFDEEVSERLRKFYALLGLSISGWSLNVPVTTLLAFELAPWVRYKIVVAVEVAFRFLGQLLLSQLLCGPLSPITARNTFPAGQAVPLESPFGQLNDGPG